MGRKSDKKLTVSKVKVRKLTDHDLSKAGGGLSLVDTAKCDNSLTTRNYSGGGNSLDGTGDSVCQCLA